jgi:protoporphyrin/coproporphyrin ferrochelatase
VPRKLAIVLFNLGGPGSPAAIMPFLRNLFSDPAILRVPVFVRFFLARIIARARLKPASANYALLGGKSPLLELTRQQADALQARFDDIEAKCFIAMRYWHPFSLATARAVKAWGAEEVVLLPLYPQYSSTTTGSSLTAWRTAAARVGLIAPVTTLCCYPTDPAYAAATTRIVQDAYDRARQQTDPSVPIRVLFSAHGLPEKIVQAGDPYQWQIEQTVQAVLRIWAQPDLDWVICYQSRATPVKWIGPSTDQEIERAGRDNVAVVVVPIAFVSEHSETLVELDIEYRDLAERHGVKGYFRAPAHNSDPGFIAALESLVRCARAHGPGLCSHAGERVCPEDRTDCPFTARSRFSPPTASQSE